MAAKKKYIYTVYVEDYGAGETFFNIKADTFKEAAEKAKRMFIRQYWNKKMLKAHLECKSDNLL